jgi:PAS domain S-box-containing protein
MAKDVPTHDPTSEELAAEAMELRRRISELEEAAAGRQTDDCSEAKRYLDVAGVMFVALDAEGRVQRINREGCEILRVPEHQIVGSDWFATFIPDRDRDNVRAWHESLISGEVEPIEQRKNAVVSASGEERLIEWRSTLTRSGDGRVTGVISSGLDVTERDRTERSQRAVHEIWNAAHGATSTAELFQMIREKLGLVLNTENFFVALYDKRTDTISLSYFVDENDQDQFESFPAGKTMTAYVLRNNTSLLLTRQEAQEWVAAGIVEIIGTPSQVWLGVPLRVRGEVIGAVVVQSYTNPHDFGPGDRDMLEFVSGQIGLAIERKRAEEALKESEARYRAIVDAVPDLMFQLDRDCTLLSYEAPSLGSLATAPEAFLGKKLRDVFSPEFHEQTLECVKAALKTGDVQLLEYRIPIPMPAGEVRDFEARIVPSGPDTVLALVRDFTEHKRADNLLRALNEAALAMERTLSPDEVLDVVGGHLRDLGFWCAVALVDESGERLVIRHVCFADGVMERVSALTGVTVESISVVIDGAEMLREVVRERKTIFQCDVTGFLKHILPEAPAEVQKLAADSLGLGKSVFAPLIADDAVFGVLAVHAGEIAEKDAPAMTAFANQLAAALRKATLLQELEESLRELKSTQDQLLQAQKMEAVGRLAGGVAHDFNNLLTAIKGYAELLLSSPGLTEGAQADIQQIRKAADQAAAMTRQLLAFSRRQPLQPQIVDVNRVVGEMDTMLRRLIGEDIVLMTTFEEDSVLLEADPGQIEQVIINMAVNARDAMPEGGRLIVKTKRVQLDDRACASIPEARPGSFACMSIEDTGVGIPKEAIDQIFEPFFSTKAPGKGTGLGLAVAYGIIRQHGGWVNVYSEPRHGTVFKIYIPASDGEESSVECETTDTVNLNGSGQRILLVEDEDAVRDFAKRALEQSGYVVFAAADADQAKCLFESENGDFALVFSDVVLPDSSGINLIDSLLTMKPGLEVLLSSGYSDHKSQWPTIQERGYHFLQKPYSLPDLLGTIKEIVKPC